MTADIGWGCRLVVKAELPWARDLQARTHGGRAMPRSDWERYLELDDRACAVACGGEQDAPVGYLLFLRLGATRRLVDIAVEPGYRRLGVATCLALPLLQRRHDVTAVCRDSCLDGQLWLRSLGFRCLRVLKGHYENPPADGYYFLRSVS